MPLAQPPAPKNNSPAGGAAGRDGNYAPVGGADDHSHFTPSRPACQAPVAIFRRWLEQARACAASDLEAAERAKACGDWEAFVRLRKRGLRHQMIQVALEALLIGG